MKQYLYLAVLTAACATVATASFAEAYIAYNWPEVSLHERRITTSPSRRALWRALFLDDSNDTATRQSTIEYHNSVQPGKAN